MSKFPFQAMDAKRSKNALTAREARKTIKGKCHVATGEMDYSKRELEFMQAMQEYKRTHGRPFPTWSEALSVLDSLGYVKLEEASGFTLSLASAA